MENGNLGVADGAAGPSGLSDDAAVAKLKAQMDAAKPQAQPEAQPEPPKAPEAPTQPVQVETQSQESEPKKGEADKLSPFRNKEGEVDPQKIEKANESLTRATKDKESRIQELLKINDERKKKFYAASENAAKLRRENEKLEAEPKLQPEYRGLTQELKNQFAQDVEKDPVDAIYRMIEMVTDGKTRPFLDEYEKDKASRQNRRQAERLDDLGQSGHDWVYTPEGREWFEDKFKSDPWLLQAPDPFGAAIRQYSESLPKSAQAEAQAQSLGVPVLGGSSAVPPPSSSPTATPEKRLEDLTSDMNLAMSQGDMEGMRKIRSEMEKLKSQIRL